MASNPGLGLNNTLGSLEIGILFATALYGSTCVQAVIYTEKKFKDAIWLRGLVGLVCLADTIHTAFIWFLLYSLTVINYGNVSSIDMSSWPLAMSIPLTSFIGASTQCFFAHRIRVISGSWIVPSIAWFGALLRIAFGFALGIMVVLRGQQSIGTYVHDYRWIIDVLLSINVSVDLLNTVASCFYLLRYRPPCPSTRRVVDKLATYAIEIGSLTSLCAMAILACSLFLPDTLIYFSILMVYPKFFSNSLLTSLNKRTAFRRQHGGELMLTECSINLTVTAPGSNDPRRHYELELMQQRKSPTFVVPVDHDDVSSFNDISEP